MYHEFSRNARSVTLKDPPSLKGPKENTTTRGPMNRRLSFEQRVWPVKGDKAPSLLDIPTKTAMDWRKGGVSYRNHEYNNTRNAVCRDLAERHP